MDLRTQIINELHKPARKKFTRRNTVLKGINDLYQADLVEVIPYSRINKGYKYILTVINCFTKVADAFPLRNKTGSHVASAMEKIIKRDKNTIKHLHTDDGKEYFNQWFSALMNKNKINHYSTKSDKKASIIERFNRTLKGSMYKIFSIRGSYVWYDILDKLIKDYNNKFHRTIGMKPIDVSKKNEKIVSARILKMTKPKIEKIKPKKFVIEDHVRISKHKTIFTKGYLPNWTNEVFTIYRVQPTFPETYILKDKNGEILQGAFYGHELLKSLTGNVYLIEKVLKKNKDKVYVRWLGFDKTQDSWISKKDLL